MADFLRTQFDRVEGWATSDATLHLDAIAQGRHLVSHMPGPGMVKFAGVLLGVLVLNELVFAATRLGLPPDIAVIAATASLGWFLWRYYRCVGQIRAADRAGKGGDNG